MKGGTYTALIEGLSDADSGNGYINKESGENGFNPIGRALTFGHEVFGHGRSAVLGRLDSQHSDAIQLENLILRVMGKGNIQRDGSNHDNNTKISNASAIPSYR
ncbi:hypothetical protein [Pedobacter sp. WC2423]|uniref:hypothetical protein n=1 Tax=Pedobacter sp. WC2423 TaxID=3234142 RepID=UPI00346792AE